MAASSKPHVSVNLRLASEGEDSEWFTALVIPLDLFSLYAVKPRKWLSYLGYAVTGSVGVLSLAQSESTPCDMDVPVNAGDVYYFFATDTTHFIDPDVMSISTSGSSGPSFKSSSPVWDVLISEYEGCPFTSFPGEFCKICPLISRVKGDAYIRRLTQERSGDPRIHMLIKKRLLALLQTPNLVLKSNDIVENADPEAYLVTNHHFMEFHPVVTTEACHGKSVALLNEDTRPPEVLFTMVYGSAALNAWAPPSAVALIRRHMQDMLYPGCVKGQGSVLANEEKEKIRKEWRGKRKEERRERLRKRNEDDEFDMLDMVLAFGRATRRSPEDSMKAAEEERKKASIDKVQGWLTDH
ncbi:hypothetical protein M0805_009437 [Coniferiporia weirii]|nr:hypothetical protein M0805_009437 [Coniferiporia weirii]